VCAGCSSPSQLDRRCERKIRRASHLHISVVGVCGSGKSTLVDALLRLGYDARQINQEHSYVRDLWRRRGSPDVLVYLAASDDTVSNRLGRSLYPHVLERQRQRLACARRNCDIYVDTDGKSPDEVLTVVLAELESRRTSI